MGQSEESFYRSSLGKVVYLIEKWGTEQEQKAAALSGKPLPPSPPINRTVRSFKEIGGII